MLRHMARNLRPIARRFLGLPTLEEQNYIGYRGSLHGAATFCARNFVAGDYAEFGVWQGDSFATAFHTVNRARRNHLNWMRAQPTQESINGVTADGFNSWKNWDMRFLAFDSFRGLPDPGRDEIHEHWAKGSFCCAEDAFLENLRHRSVNLDCVTTIPGFYDVTLNQETKDRYNLRPLAIAMIDCDLYESTALVLDFITDLLVQGSVLIFDDWFYYRGSPRRGQQRACREWLERNPEIELVEFWREPPQPVSFIVNLERPISSSQTSRSAAAQRNQRENSTSCGR